MGANQSHGDGMLHDPGLATNKSPHTNDGYHAPGSYNNQNMVGRPKKSKAKPSPPFRLRFLDVTDSSITLSWQNPHQLEGHSIIAYTVEIAVGRNGQWRTLTKSCQGTTYDARHLEPNTSYVFRVRSENIYGIGKPSLPSEVCITNIYKTSPADIRSYGTAQSVHRNPDEYAQTTRRQYGFSVHIGGGVRSMLNHSDIAIESPSVSSHSTAASIYDKSQKSQILLRNNIHRTSLPSARKISTPILLPGTGNNSLSRLRESRRSLRTEISDTKLKCATRDSGIGGLRESLTVFDSSSLDIRITANCEDVCKIKTPHLASFLPVHSNDTFTNSLDGDSGKGSKCSLCDTSKVSDNQSVSNSTDSDLVSDMHDIKSVMTASDNNNMSENRNVLDKVNESADDIYKLKEEMMSLDICDDKLKIGELKDEFNDVTSLTTDSQNGYYSSLDNPWQREISLNGVSEQILAAPLSDDVKMALHSRNLPEDHRFTFESGHSLTRPNTGEATDFRTLRGVLQSNNMIVKNSRSLPDVVEVNGESRSITKGKLSTIMDADEEDDPVKITTL